MENVFLIGSFNPISFLIENIPTLICFILVLGVVIIVHETGHFLFAKLCGIYVYEFSIGMGPKIFHYKKKGGETEYCLRAIPIGGFVQLAGEEVEDDTNVPKNRKLQDKKPWQRFLTMFFGAGFNFLFAMLLLFMIGLFNGAPKLDPVLTQIEPNSQAALAGLEEGDRILKIDGKKISTIDDISLYLTIKDHSNPTEFECLKKSGKKVTYEVTPTKEEVDDQTVYRYGIALQGEVETGFFASLRYMIQKTGSLFKQMWVTIVNLFTGGIKVNQLSGPVGIYNVVGGQSKTGFANMVYLVAFLSINVGFINLLPFPAFDGGRILFVVIEKIKGSPVKAETENIIHSIGFFLLMALMLCITINDIIKLF